MKTITITEHDRYVLDNVDTGSQSRADAMDEFCGLLEEEVARYCPEGIEVSVDWIDGMAPRHITISDDCGLDYQNAKYEIHLASERAWERMWS